MIILFLADGSSKIGMGHVYRSINLANELKNDYEIIFITREKISFKFFKKIKRNSASSNNDKIFF